jgi:pyruvate kinase
MMIHQMNVARLNFSWGNAAEHAIFTALIRKIAAEQNIRVPIIFDLSGPRTQETGSHHFGGDTGSVITQKDRDDVASNIHHEPEYFAQSYVGSAADIEELRAVLHGHGKSPGIIAKIERAVAVENAEQIIAAADAIMIARGDLGNEVALEKIPFIEDDLIKKSRAAGKPVIVATEMMPSMIESDRPTRSDVTDVAYATILGADAVMLSNETATGHHPVEVVAEMERILLEAERNGLNIPRRPL